MPAPCCGGLSSLVVSVCRVSQFLFALATWDLGCLEEAYLAQNLTAALFELLSDRVGGLRCVHGPTVSVGGCRRFSTRVPPHSFLVAVGQAWRRLILELAEVAF